MAMLSPPMSILFSKLALKAFFPGPTSLQPLPVAMRSPRFTLTPATNVFRSISYSPLFGLLPLAEDCGPLSEP